MSYSQSDLEALRQAYASGALTVRFSDGKLVTFDTGSALLQRIRVIEKALSATPAPTHWNPQFSRQG